VAGSAGAALVVLAGCRDDGAGSIDADGRTGPLLVAVDEDTVFVYGGDGVDGPRNDAFLADVATGDTVPVDDPPLAHGLTNIAQGLPVGDEIMLLGHPCGEEVPDDPMGTCTPGLYGAAVFSVADETWRAVDLPASLAEVEHGRRTPVGVASDGRAVWVLGGSDFGGPAQFWTYDVAGDVWSRLPAIYQRVDQPCIAGDRVVVVHRSTRRSRRASLLTLDLSEAGADWRESPPVPPLPRGNTGIPQDVLCLGDRVLVHDPFGDPAYLRDVPGDGATRWKDVPRFDAMVPDHLVAGDAVVVIDDRARHGGVLAYDEAGDRWRPVGDSPGDVDRPVWTGDRLVGWSRSGAGLVVVDVDLDT
jgi:hypothetical protein